MTAPITREELAEIKKHAHMSHLVTRLVETIEAAWAENERLNYLVRRPDGEPRSESGKNNLLWQQIDADQIKIRTLMAENERLKKADKILDRLVALDAENSREALLKSNHAFANRLRDLLDDPDTLRDTFLAVIKEWDKLS